MRTKLFRKILFFQVVCLLSVNVASAQVGSVTLSGRVKARRSQSPLAWVNLVLTTEKEAVFITGAVSDGEGRFTLSGIKPGNYILEASLAGYTIRREPVFVGTLSEFLNIPPLELDEDSRTLDAVVIQTKTDEISNKLDKKTYSISDNPSQAGGSVLQAMQNLPGITIQEGKVQLRGSDKVAVLIDGKQTALTGFGSQTGLDNIPASAIDKIEIINNPSAKYDANGNAGIINIVMKKSRQKGFNGKVGVSTGAGALWVRRDNLPSIRPQYTFTPKVNPTLSLNYRNSKLNAFLQADHLFTHTLNKNEFVTRTYSDGTIIRQQLKRNRNTNYFTSKAGIDWYIDDRNSLTVSGLFGSEKIIDRGDQPFFNDDLSKRLRLWQFLEDELKTTVMASASYQHKFSQAGHLLNAGFNYTFHREDEKYFYDNYLPQSTGTDAFKLLSDEQVYDLNLDYIRPLRYGRFETGLKFRYRNIPTDMNFIPGVNSVLDTGAGGWATYRETIPAIYGNYVFENARWEAELGLRLEHVKIRYEVNPDHNTYTSDGYDYSEPFPNFRLAYKINDRNKLSLFYNRRVDRPNEVDIRIFPKYDDAEIIKVGNPALRPQFTNSFELGYKTNWSGGSLYGAGYYRFTQANITRISVVAPGSNLIYAIFQNAGKSQSTGLEMVFSQRLAKWYTFSLNTNLYYNRIDAFTVNNLYPVPNTFSADAQTAYSGNVKLNNNLRLPGKVDVQVTAVYLAPDIIPQGRIAHRFTLDLGFRKTVRDGKGEWFLNATDLFNTLLINKDIRGNGFIYSTADYYETQVVRAGYTCKF